MITEIFVLAVVSFILFVCFVYCVYSCWMSLMTFSRDRIRPLWLIKILKKSRIFCVRRFVYSIVQQNFRLQSSPFFLSQAANDAREATDVKCAAARESPARPHISHQSLPAHSLAMRRKKRTALRSKNMYYQTWPILCLRKSRGAQRYVRCTDVTF